jgi:hypothetical protein
MGPNSVVCAFPIYHLNILIEEGVEYCCHSSNSSSLLSRGLDFFQTPSFCPNPVSRKSGPLTCEYPVELNTGYFLAISERAWVGKGSGLRHTNHQPCPGRSPSTRLSSFLPSDSLR